jgi:hypothetical protein
MVVMLFSAGHSSRADSSSVTGDAVNPSPGTTGGVPTQDGRHRVDHERRSSACTCLQTELPCQTDPRRRKP